MVNFLILPAASKRYLPYGHQKAPQYMQNDVMAESGSIPKAAAEEPRGPVVSPSIYRAPSRQRADVYLTGVVTPLARSLTQLQALIEPLNCVVKERRRDFVVQGATGARKCSFVCRLSAQWLLVIDKINVGICGPSMKNKPYSCKFPRGDEDQRYSCTTNRHVSPCIRMTRNVLTSRRQFKRRQPEDALPNSYSLPLSPSASITRKVGSLESVELHKDD